MRTRYFATLKTILTSAVLMLLLASCQKEADAPVNCPQTMAGIAGTYKPTGLTYRSSASAPEQDYFALMDACEKDDKVILDINGTYDYQDTGLACSPDGSNSGTWSVSGNTITSDGITNGTIQSFDCRKLVVVTNDIIVPGDKLTLTMERQ